MNAQIGGSNTYEFLNLTHSARVSSLGNVLVNSFDDDINLAQQIPSLNHQGMNHQFSVNFTNYYAGVKFGSLIYGIPSSRFENICVGLQYLNYGNFVRTDAFGNVLGSFTAGEYAVFTSTSMTIDSSLYVGLGVKAIYSNLDAYDSFGVLADLSASYSLKDGRMVGTLLARNLGYQLTSYAGLNEPLPFELLLGVSTKLEHAPMRWSITWAHLEKWDLSFVDSELPLIDPLTNELIDQSSSLRDRIFSHLHLGTELLFSENFNVRLGYNFRRRQELALELFKHNVGLTWGFSMKVRKFHFNYARAAYHAIGPMHTFSMTSSLTNFLKK